MDEEDSAGPTLWGALVSSYDSDCGRGCTDKLGLNLVGKPRD